MLCLNIKNLLFTYLFMYKKFCVQSEYSFKQIIKPNTPSMIQTIMQDMQQAFVSITNNTHVFRQMYDFETSNTDISTLLFKLPSSEESPETETLMLMDRREFIAPTFPNLTQSYITLRRLKLLKIPINSNMTELLKVEMQNIVQDYGNDTWTDLGLHGWKGDTADSKKHPHHKQSSTVANDYPYTEITKELHRGQTNEYVNEIETHRMSEKAEEDQTSKNIDKQIFIARVNDPFGYSTNWQIRNVSTQNKYKRNVLGLYSMIKCSTGCEPIVYKGYGCYCGFLGDGVPTDGIDRCCKLHDKCYQHSNCISFLEYFVPYVWKCYRGKPLCAIDHGEWGGPQSCAARLCNCDSTLSRCLREYACPGHRTICRSSASRALQNLWLTT